MACGSCTTTFGSFVRFSFFAIKFLPVLRMSVLFLTINIILQTLFYFNKYFCNIAIMPKNNSLYISFQHIKPLIGQNKVLFELICDDDFSCPYAKDCYILDTVAYSDV